MLETVNIFTTALLNDHWMLLGVITHIQSSI